MAFMQVRSLLDRSRGRSIAPTPAEELVCCVCVPQAEPPFDRRPELLFEIISHVLEEEVRRLQHELERRLKNTGVAPPA